MGDGFLHNTFQQYFVDARSPDGKLNYINAHYDMHVFSNDYPDEEYNILERLEGLLADAINARHLLPKAIIILLDDDLLDNLNHYKTGITQPIGMLIEWLANVFHENITDYKKKLPSKSRKFKFPSILWCLIPQHDVYDHYNDYKDKFNRAVTNTVKLFREMDTLDLKTWEPSNKEYFGNGRITPTGLAAYWGAINNAFEVWDRLQMKEKFAQPPMASHHSRKATDFPKKSNYRRRSDSQDYRNFHRERQSSYEKYHWRANNTRFKLPPPRT